MSNNFYDLGLQDAKNGKCLSETAMQFLEQESNLKAYFQGYSSFVNKLSKEAQAKKDAASHLLNYIDDIIGLNATDGEIQKDPRDYVFGDNFKINRYIELSSSTGIRIEYYCDGITFDDIKEVLIVNQVEDSSSFLSSSPSFVWETIANLCGDELSSYNN